MSSNALKKYYENFSQDNDQDTNHTDHLVEELTPYKSLENPPTMRNFTKFLDEDIDKIRKYSNNWVNQPNSIQFCCFINLKYESQKDNIYTFTGSATYEENYNLSPFSYILVWNSVNNTYYLNDDRRNKKYIDEIYDIYDDMILSGKQIITQFFKNPPKFQTGH